MEQFHRPADCRIVRKAGEQSVMSLELVDVIVAENLLLLYKLNHFISRDLIKVSHFVMQKEEVLLSRLSK